ncbi:Dimethyladenosine transferase 1, mitochondrial [Smittium culicis]|uniref:rRNA adenine N(6)-methyltransferase n=1 Tax=Smittium culicis TaxID=133412 RepID=A0A1R1YJ16_9FUNG|nr:Dimethyladenosine transferase 1, mitochondrial [Smittium culicis]
MLHNKQGIFQFKNSKMTLMFQKEVGQRIAAPSGNSLRGRLSVMSQSICDVKEVYLVNPASFVPSPKVSAVVVNLTPLEVPIIQCMGWDAEMLPLLELAGISSFLRPQDIDTDKICALAKILEDRNIKLPFSKDY